MASTLTPLEPPMQDLSALNAEQTALPEKIRTAKQAGNAEELQRLRAREEVLPVLIARGEIARLETSIAELEAQRPELQRATDAAGKAREEAWNQQEAAKRAFEQAHGDLQTAVHRLNSNGSQTNNLKTELAAAKAKLEAL